MNTQLANPDEPMPWDEIESDRLPPSVVAPSAKELARLVVAFFNGQDNGSPISRSIVEAAAFRALGYTPVRAPWLDRTPAVEPPVNPASQNEGGE